MSAPTSDRVLAAVQAAGVRYALEPGWDDPAIDAYPRTWDPAYVIVHHTANGGAEGDAPSLRAILHTAYAPIRGAHFLVARSGIVHVCYSLGAYHAGAGGPGSWGGGPLVPADTMNRRAYGIEVESAGMSLDTAAMGGTDGITPAQYEATSRLAAALLDMLGAPATRAINHKTWAPGRKVDTRDTDAAWHARIAAAMGEDEDMIDYAELAKAVWDHKMRDPVTDTEETARTVLQRTRVNAKQAATRTGGTDADAVAVATIDELARRLGA